MTVTVLGSGSQTAVIGTEHTLQDSSAAGIYALEVDTINMAAGDVMELRIYVMVLSSGTRRVAYLGRYAGAQAADDLIKLSIPAPIGITDAGAWRATLKQTAGTGRVYPWTALSL